MTPNIDKIIEHYNDCQNYFSGVYDFGRFSIGFTRSNDIVRLHCKAWLKDANSRPYNPSAINRLYDCIAAILHIIDTLEGQRALGKPEEVKQ